MKFILAIDDMPDRYIQLSKFLLSMDIFLLVTCRMEDVRFYLNDVKYPICGILLDNDMPFQDGQYFVDYFLKEHSIPIVISSHNVVAAENLLNKLNEYDVPTIKAPVEFYSQDNYKVYMTWQSVVLKHFKI